MDSQGKKEAADDAGKAQSEQKVHSKDGDGANPSVATLKGSKQIGANARQPASASVKQQKTKINLQIAAKIDDATPYESDFEGEPLHRSTLACTDVVHRNT